MKQSDYSKMVKDEDGLPYEDLEEYVRGCLLGYEGAIDYPRELFIFLDNILNNIYDYDDMNKFIRKFIKGNKKNSEGIAAYVLFTLGKDNFIKSTSDLMGSWKVTYKGHELVDRLRELLGDK